MVLKAEKEELEKNKVRIKVEVPADEVKKAIDRAFRDIAREVFIPGFRKGKVPRRVLQARLGMEPIYDEVKQANLPEYYREALEQLGIEPIDEPEIDVDEIEVEEGKPMAFEATVEIKPRVELAAYKGVEVERPDLEVTEDEVAQVLEGMREKFAQLEVASGKTLAEGDFALIDFTGTVNDKPIEGGSASDYMLEIGSQNIWPEFNQELVGKRKGDILDIRVKMPEHYPDEEMAGKIASFKTIVKEVKVKRLPKADDDFAKEASKFDTLDELKADVRAKLEEVKKAQGEESVSRQALEKLADGLEVEIPEKMLEDYSHHRRHELEARLASRGISMEEYLKAIEYSEERMEEELKKEAERLIRNELVLEAVVRAEAMEISDEEMDEEIARRAGLLGIETDRYRELVERQGREGLREELLQAKALKFLGEHAVYAGEGGKDASARETARAEKSDEGERASEQGEPGGAPEEPGGGKD